MDLHKPFLHYEVKNWNINQIIEANPQYFLLNIDDKTEGRTNPYRQVKAYFDYVMEKLKEDRYLSKDPKHLGKPRIPVSYGVVFPNIDRLQFMETGLSTIIY
ncbi:MAG: hypothetical protein N2596_03850 [Syntrophorhabdaceae bacterium]|nr:hypothetical protein [Syntrophorhabdaceae bacterium]